MRTSGRVTIPTDESFVEGTREIAAKWGADAVRDCDGTVLPKNAKELGKVYNTYFIVRGDNEWGRRHPEEAQRIFLMSERVLAVESSVKIPFMAGFLRDQFDPDYANISRWQVCDRTTGEMLAADEWEVNRKKHEITIPKAKKMHEYTVSFLARVTWHPVQVYNYITNNWTCEKQLTYDPAYPATKEYIKKHMREWCENNPDTSVVRFTTFLYQFTLIFNEQGKEKYVDWFGYGQTANLVLMDEFEKETGLKLTAEDFVDGGYYNNTFRNPTLKFRKWQDFIARFVSKTVRALVDICHEYGKEAMMFLGDDWIGAEPYGKYFSDMNLDAVVGSVGGGVTVRMLSEIPHVKYREGRFLPYFFPDTFFEGNEQGAVDELNRNWLTARRALMRKPLDRMGFGGYLSLAAKFPDFVSRVTEICDEFRTIIHAVGENKPYCALKVGILNAWGSLRSWQSHMVAHELWYQQIYSYQGILESLSGLPIDVAFLSFDDVRNGVPEGIDVLVNAGDAYTAFSGGKEWRCEKLQAAIREFVYNGGGFVGVGEPTACEGNGRYFQLADVLGVDEEVGFTLSQDKYNIEKAAHELTEGLGKTDYGEDKKNIYALNGTKVLDIAFSDRFKRSVNVGEVKMAANEFGKGKSFYITGLPYSFENSRLLYKALTWCAGKDLYRAYAENVNVECNYYPASGKYALVNNGKQEQTTDFYDVKGNKRTVVLAPMQIKWIEE
ncbi:MAG: 1,3-beta-galactosyl-N-acetylhexosamine phosphorylase [Clostridia bacterium]|nr:1,3-beta-galactosyl-N-acetylhexosamine phosphorylase [Clostridia bacterium]